MAENGAHPRSRGENAPIVSVLPFNQGSSPLTRGKPLSVIRTAARRRLIPAHAGKTLMQPNLPPKGSAHPRSRGENTVCARSSALAIGSSPLTRGKRAGDGFTFGVRGLIPAHAGKTRGVGEP